MEMSVAIRQVMAGRNLEYEQMQSVMHRIMTGEATPAQIGGFLVALAMKGETVDEITAAAGVMRALSTGVTVPGEGSLLDTCGTGGDGASTFNISTASAIVAAAAGARVAKHGNRAASGRSGSADVLEAAGVRLDLSADEVGQCIAEVGVGFMFAPAHHGAMRHAIGPRRELGVRTLFNVLGPLTNPAGAHRQLLGVFDARWLLPLAQVLRELGSAHVMIVHADDGLDEISLAAPTQVVELRHGSIRRYSIAPEDFDLKRQSLDALRVDDAAQSLNMIRSVLADQPGPARDIVLLNAGAAIYVAGLTDSISTGIERAHEVIATGQAAAVLDALSSFGRAA